MKGTIILFAMSMAIALCLVGCGGSNSSSTAETSPPPLTEQSPPLTEQFSSLEINPLSDLGLMEGDNVCFKVKSYNNVTVSDYSNPVCSEISNALKLTLSWNEVTGNINGYYVYFGTDENNANNFLADVIES